MEWFGFVVVLLSHEECSEKSERGGRSKKTLPKKGPKKKSAFEDTPLPTVMATHGHTHQWGKECLPHPERNGKCKDKKGTKWLPFTWFVTTRHGTLGERERKERVKKQWTPSLLRRAPSTAKVSSNDCTGAQ